jgi:hypothetical protein
MNHNLRPDGDGTIRFTPATRLAHDPRDHMLGKAALLLGVVWLILIWRVLLVI